MIADDKQPRASEEPSAANEQKAQASRAPLSATEWIKLADAALAGAIMLLRSAGDPAKAALEQMADYLESVRDQRPPR